MADFDPMDGYLKEAFARMTEGTDPGRVAVSVRERIGSEKERKNGNTMKRTRKLTVLLAAAVLLIVGTIGAGAAQILSRLTVRVRPAEGWEENSPEARSEDNASTELGKSYTQLFTVEQEGDEPYVTLSDEVMTKLLELERETDRNAAHSSAGWIEDGKAYGFDTWKEAADFLDCGVLTSPLLEQPPEQFSNNRISLMYLEGEALGRSENIVSISGQNTVPSLSGDEIVWCDLIVRIPLNAEACGMGFGGAAVPATGEEGAELVTAAHVTPSGIEAQIAAYRWDVLDTSLWYGDAYVLHDSISYMFHTHGESAEAVTAILRAVLDSLE